MGRSRLVGARLRLLAIVFLSVPALPALEAHDLGQSESRLDVDGRVIRMALMINPMEFKYIDQDQSGVVSVAEVDQAIPAIFGATKALVAVSAAAAPVKVTLERHQLLNDGTLRLDIGYEFAEPVTEVHVSSAFGDLSRPDHTHAMTMYADGERYDAVLDANRRTFDQSIGPGWLRSPAMFLVAAAVVLLGARVAVFLWGRRKAA